MSVMFLNHWVTTSVTPKCLSLGETVPAVVKITLKGQFIAHCDKFRVYWVGGGWREQCGKEGEYCWPVCSQVKVRNVLLDSKAKQG